MSEKPTKSAERKPKSSEKPRQRRSASPRTSAPQAKSATGAGEKSAGSEKPRSRIRSQTRSKPEQSAADTPRRITDALDDRHIEEAEALVDEAAVRVSSWFHRAKSSLEWVVGRAQEEAEDIYAEAEELRASWRE